MILIPGGAVVKGNGVYLRVKSLIYSFEITEIWFVYSGADPRVVEEFSELGLTIKDFSKFSILDFVVGCFLAAVRLYPLQCGLFFRHKAIRAASRTKKKPVLVHTVRPLLFCAVARNDWIFAVDVCEKMSITFRQGSKFLLQRGKLVQAFVYGVESFLLARLEKRALQKFTTFWINAAELDVVSGKHQVIRQIVERFSPVDIEAVSNKIYFIGPGDYFPNSDSVSLLIDNPPAGHDLYIIGKGYQGLRRKTKGSVQFTGWVDDLRDVVSPGGYGWAVFRLGRGTQNKVFDYLKCGLLPVMSPQIFQSCFPDLDESEFLEIVIKPSTRYFVGVSISRFKYLYKKLYQSVQERFI